MRPAWKVGDEVQWKSLSHGPNKNKRFKIVALYGEDVWIVQLGHPDNHPFTVTIEDITAALPLAWEVGKFYRRLPTTTLPERVNYTIRQVIWISPLDGSAVLGWRSLVGGKRELYTMVDTLEGRKHYEEVDVTGGGSV